MEINADFLKFLQENPAALDKFLGIIAEWYKLQKTAPAPVKAGDGPHEWKVGDTVELTTEFISDEDIRAIEEGYAVATAKEKFMEYAKGFMTGVMFKAGGLL